MISNTQDEVTRLCDEEPDVSEEFRRFCNENNIFVYRNRRIKLSNEKLKKTAGIILKIKDRRIRCEIYFGKDIKKELVIELFRKLPVIGELYALELFQIPFIPSEIEKLFFLEILAIESSYITFLPEEMCKLVDLKELDLRLKNLKYIPEWIVSLEKLEILDLYGTKIDVIPDNINNLLHLKILDLCCTHLKKMPASILDLNLQFKDHFNEKDTSGIYFCDSTCENPSTEIILGNRDRLKYYYSSNRTIHQKEVRVILLGQKGAGKTSVVQRLKELEDNKPYFKENNEWTQGISINKLGNSKDGILHIWDFGGQEMMLSTHTLFMRDHCIYIIVLNARQGDEPERWLDYIRQYGKNSSIFIVNNHMDMADASRIDINKLKRLYSELSIVNNQIWEISCVKPEEYPLTDFYRQLLNTAENYFDKMIPYSWSILNTELGNLTNNGKQVNYITQEDFLRISRDCGINELEERVEALNWLNEIGTVFTYGNPQAIEKLTELKVLRPAWVTDAIFKIINNIKPQEDSCHVSHDDIRLALIYGKSENETEHIYSDSEIGFILEVMRKFCLSFKCTETNEFIPAIAQNEEFEEIAEWVENQNENSLDILYNLSQKGKQKNRVSSINLAYFYQVVIQIVENYNEYPRMWRFGALFENICNMQILLFLQNKGKWDYEMHLMIKSKEGEERRITAADFHQCVLGYLKKFVSNSVVDVKVLVEGDFYASVDEVSGYVFNGMNELYYPNLDRKIQFHDEVLTKVMPDSSEHLTQIIEQLKSRSDQPKSSVYALDEHYAEKSRLQSDIHKLTNMIESVLDKEPQYLEKAYLYIEEYHVLCSQLQSIIDSSNSQKDEISIIKKEIEKLADNSDKRGIAEKLFNALSIISALVTCTTSDYSKIRSLIELLKEFLMNIKISG